MPRDVDIKIFQIARTAIDREEVARWMQHIGADNFRIPSIVNVSNPALLIALAAKRCYMSFEPGLNPNVTRVRSDYVEYFDNILKSGHGSVLEHASYSYAIEGVSRVFTAEMNRHHAGWGVSEGSLRFIRFDKDIPFWMPHSFETAMNDDPDLITRKIRSQTLFIRAFLQAEQNYAEFMRIWDMNEGDKNFSYKKKVTSAGRRIVPMGVATGGLWTGNIRALRHVLALRTEPAAEEEIAHVGCLIAEDIVKREPMLFQDFEIHDGQAFPKYRKV